MVATLEARRLTVAHRDAQSRIGVQTVLRLRDVWPLLQLENVDRSFDRWLRAATSVVQSQRSVSSRLAANYLSVFKSLETGKPREFPRLQETADTDALATSLLVTGPLSIKRAMARGVQLAKAADVAEATSAASGMRYALNGGRDTITQMILHDDDALGYERIVTGTCDFCMMLVGRGAVYKEDTVDFQAHDNCRCQPEPLYGRFSRRAADKPTAAQQGRLSQDQQEIVGRSYSQWGTGARNAEARAALKATADGKTLVRAVDQFQSTQGGVARFRDAVDAVVQGRGAALPVATRENADAILDALRTADADGKTLYRGLKIKGNADNILATYAEGETVDLGMSSFSSNQTVANHFMTFGAKRGETQVSIRVDAPDQALPLSNMSKSKHAADLREYVAGGQFEVVSARKTGPNKISLLLRQIAGL